MSVHTQTAPNPMSQSEANKHWQTTMYPDLIRVYGQPSDVSHLASEEIQPHYCVEYVLHMGFSDAMSGKVGLIIGKSGDGLKKIQDEMNKVHGGAHTIQWEDIGTGIPNEDVAASVQAIWAKNLPDGRTAFTAYGKNPDALCQALQMIRDKAMTILEKHGWTVYTRAWRMTVILKNLKHSNWSEEKEASEGWNTYSRRYELLLEQDIKKTYTHFPKDLPLPLHLPKFAEFDKVYNNQWVRFHPHHVLPNMS